MPKSLPTPSADTKSVRDLVGLMMTGRVRVPVYQRALQWDASDVRSLFDSIYRGFPVGSLLLHNRPAPAARLELGPLMIIASEQSSAFDVVDGQQRLVALTASLARPEPIPTTPVDPYVVYFDPVGEGFVGPPASGEVPDTWVPLPAMAEASRLSEWVFHWAHAQDKTLRARVFEAGARIRDYKVPLYSVSVDEGDADVLRDIFNRVNSSGKPLKWEVIHDALYGSRAREASPSTIVELITELAALGMGRLDEGDVLRCLVGFEGRDVTRSYREHERESPRFLEGGAARALHTLRRVLVFLRDHAAIVHLRLLPWSAPLPVLSRFFRLHPEPSARSLELLTWWLWRGLLSIGRIDERTLQRRGVREIKAEDEEASVQRLLAMVPKIDPCSYALPERFDARASQTRIALLGLASLQPRDLESGQPIDVAAALEEGDLKVFRKIFAQGALTSSPANRALLTGDGSARAGLLAYQGGLLYREEVWRSHALSAAAAAALRDGDAALFVQERSRLVVEATQALATRLSGWGRSARPSIDYILRSAAP